MILFNWKAQEPSGCWKTDSELVVVWGEFGVLMVSRTVGTWIYRMCTRRVLRPRWLQFIDQAGSMVLLRTQEVGGMRDTSPDIRERRRNLEQLLDNEVPPSY